MKQYVNTLPVGAVLDSGQQRYRIVKVLGQGGFGITYQAVAKIKVGNVTIDGFFAIKEHFLSSFCGRQGASVTIPNPSNVQEVNDSLNSFLTEAERLNRLSLEHDGLVKVNESFQANGTAYYVMEYIGGENLRQYVKRQPAGRLSEAEALPIIRQVAEAVSYLHENQVTHLDIKPDNILLRDDGTPVLIDFGLAKHYDKKGKATSTLKVAGCSDGYSPLEQYAGIDHFSPQADVYALAATLLYMLTGKDPRKASEISREQIEQSLPSDVSVATQAAIVHAMQMVTANRTASVSQFSSDLLSGGSTRENVMTERAGEDGEGVATVKRTRTREPWWNKKSVVYYAATSAIALLVVIFGILALRNSGGDEPETVEIEVEETVEAVAEVVEEAEEAEEAVAEDMADSDKETFTVNDVSFNMVRVEGGTFQMGSNDSEVYEYEKPVHQVTLSTFSIGETEVTQALWEAVMGSNPSNWNGGNLPVEKVSWDDCQTFIQKLNQLTGKRFRLPTEAEWEYAARGGNKSRGYKYSGSNSIGDVAWYDGNSSDKTHPVKTKQANELGLYDMSGNVWEWCQDWKGNYNNNAQTNPTGPSSASYRVNRGGCFSGTAKGCRVSNRIGYKPGEQYYNGGLRLAL